MGQRRLSGLHKESHGFDNPKWMTFGQQFYRAMAWCVESSHNWISGSFA
jgi:hypothetical protein